MHRRCDYFVRILYCFGPVWSINYYYYSPPKGGGGGVRVSSTTTGWGVTSLHRTAVYLRGYSVEKDIQLQNSSTLQDRITRGCEGKLAEKFLCEHIMISLLFDTLVNTGILIAEQHIDGI